MTSIMMIKMVKEREVICDYCKKKFTTEHPLKRFCTHMCCHTFHRVIKVKEVFKLNEHDRMIWKEYNEVSK